MTIEQYFQTRYLFESRFIPNELGWCFISEMNKGIKKFDLFFSIYGHDRQIQLTSVVYSIDKNKRYKIPFKNISGTKIKILNTSKSLFEKHPDAFTRLLKQIEKS